MDTLSAYYDERVKEYKKYISNHIANVKKCYNIYGKELCNRLNVDYDKLGKLIEIHDLSKYSEEEFEGIRSYYFPTPSEESDEELRGFRKSKYNAAWLHHLRNNPHHPEYWMHSNTDDEDLSSLRVQHISIGMIQFILSQWINLQEILLINVLNYSRILFLNLHKQLLEGCIFSPLNQCIC